MHLKPILISSMIVASCLASNVQANDLNWTCDKANSSKTTCFVQIERVIPKDSYLYIYNLADIDQAFIENVSIGKTGYIGNPGVGFRYYAQFLPRVYSLEAFEGKRNLNIRLEVESVFADAVGLSPDGSKVQLISQSTILSHLLSDLSKPALLLLVPLLLLFAIPFTTAPRDVMSAWRFEWSEKAVHVSGALFALSMSKWPRAVIPSLIANNAYYRAHAIILSLFTFFAGHTLLRISVQYLTKKRLRVLQLINLSVVASCILLILIPSGLSFGGSVKELHSVVFSAQNVVLMAIWILAVPRHLAEILQSGLISSRLAILIYAALPFALLRDTWVYSWYHASGTFYFIHYCALALLLIHVIAAHEIRAVRGAAATFSALLRARLSQAQSGYGRLSSICQSLSSREMSGFAGGFLRVSITQIDGNMARLVTSEGTEAKPAADRDPSRPLSPLMQSLCDRRSPIYIADPKRTHGILGTNGMSRAFIMIPIIQNSRVVAVFSAMAPENFKLSGRSINLIDATASAMQLEILSAISEHSENQRANQIQEVLKITSGLITEYLDDQGRFVGEGIRSQRVIISADLMRSSGGALMGREFEQFRELYSESLDLLYAQWMEARSGFSFKSKDPRGDDFWALSNDLGSGRPAVEVIRDGVILACRLDQIASDIFSMPRYRPLGILGAHVAMVIGEIEMCVRGKGSYRSIDPESPAMTVCAKLRSKAYPGTVLMECTDSRLEDVLKTLVGEQSISVPQALDFDEVPAVFTTLPKLVRIRWLRSAETKAA